MTLNVICPFTDDAQAYRDGLMLSEQFSTRRKKELTPEDMLPYLKRGTPEWAENDIVLHGKRLMKEIKTHNIGGDVAYRASRKALLVKIDEEIEQQLESPNEDTDYIVAELRKLKHQP